MKNLALNIKTFIVALPCVLVAYDTTAAVVLGAAYVAVLITFLAKTKRGCNILRHLYEQSLEIDNFITNHKSFKED